MNVKSKIQVVLDAQTKKAAERVLKQTGLQTVQDLFRYFVRMADSGKMTINHQFTDSEEISPEKLDEYVKMEKEMIKQISKGETNSSVTPEEHFKQLGI